MRLRPGEPGKRLGSEALPEGERRHAEVPLDVAREIGRRRKGEVLRNPPHGDVLLKKEPCDLARSEEVDEVPRAPPAHPAADFRKIFGRDAEFLRVPGEVPVLAKGSVGEFPDEAPKEKHRPGGDGRLRAGLRVDVVEVEHVRGEKVAHEFVVKEVRGFEKALPKSFNVFYASRQGGGGEPHHGILKEREVPHDPVVGTKRDVEGHLRRERKDERPKVDRGPKVPREDDVRKDHVVARRHVVADLSMFKAETSRPRDDVENAVFSDVHCELVDGIVEVD